MKQCFLLQEKSKGKIGALFKWISFYVLNGIWMYNVYTLSLVNLELDNIFDNIWFLCEICFHAYSVEKYYYKIKSKMLII